MAKIYTTILGIAARAIKTLKMIAVTGAIEEAGVAKVIEFYVPTNFRKSMKWVAEPQRGKIIAFYPQTKKSA